MVPAVVGEGPGVFSFVCLTPFIERYDLRKDMEGEVFADDENACQQRGDFASVSGVDCDELDVCC